MAVDVENTSLRLPPIRYLSPAKLSTRLTGGFSNIFIDHRRYASFINFFYEAPTSTTIIRLHSGEIFARITFFPRSLFIVAPANPLFATRTRAIFTPFQVGFSFINFYPFSFASILSSLCYFPRAFFLLLDVFVCILYRPLLYASTNKINFTTLYTTAPTLSRLCLPLWLFLLFIFR